MKKWHVVEQVTYPTIDDDPSAEAGVVFFGLFFGNREEVFTQIRDKFLDLQRGIEGLEIHSLEPEGSRECDDSLSSAVRQFADRIEELRRAGLSDFEKKPEEAAKSDESDFGRMLREGLAERERTHLAQEEKKSS